MQTPIKQHRNVYIFQQNTYHYFRLTVPSDIRPILKRTEIRVSLHTSDRIAAKRKASRISANLWDIFDSIRKEDKRIMALTSEQIQALVKAWIDKELEEDETERLLSLKAPVDIETLEAIDETNYLLDAECREALATNNYSKVKACANEIISDNNLSISSKDIREYAFLCREILKGQIEIFRILQDRNSGIYPASYTAVDTHLYNRNVEISNAKSIHKTLLSEAFKAYTEDKIVHGNWTTKTQLDVSDKVNTFIAIMNDVSLREVTQESLREAEKVLINFPSNKNKSPKYRDLTIKDIVKLNIPEEDRIKGTTVRNYFNQINGFLKWTKTIYELPDWFDAVITTPKQDEDTRKSKNVFDKSDLNTIFNDPWYVEGNTKLAGKGNKKILDGAKFWIPLMALYSGARLEELCQLYIEDFKVIDDTKCFEITTVIEDEDGNVKKVKDVKNKVSRRIVPIHDELLKLGLWEYVQELKTKGHTRLFEELERKKSSDKYSHNFSKWFNRHLQDYLGIKGNAKDGAKVFYSFRHTFINYCVQHSIEDKFFERVVGHKVSGNAFTLGHYAKAMSPKTLKAEVLDKMDFEIDLSHLRGNPFARTFH